tara:strand:- start:1628 stop:2149 length:522 start_codon:yes stop_codon:yes gene_type:complete
MADENDKCGAPEASEKSGAGCRIVHISLDDPKLVARNPDIEHERRVAIFDLIEGNHFRLVSGKTGPFRVLLSLSERGIQFDISDTDNTPLEIIDISMAPFRRHIRDYFMVCESYYDAIRTATPDKIETIDQARRALHNEGAETLQTRIAGQADIDDDTARRLFTLISVLQMRA